MIDHVSIGVSNIDQATEFYAAVLEVLGFRKLAEKTGTVGFGKKYPEFWLNHRPALSPPSQDNGCHACLKARSKAVVDQFYSIATQLGASSSGEPGYRPEYHNSYYACFIRDTDENHVEVVTFDSDHG